MKLEQNVSQIPCPLIWCDMLCDSRGLGLERCYCPYIDCSALVVNECGGRVKKEKCPIVKGSFSFNARNNGMQGLGVGF
ncbi:hypothetical protein Leryth_011271 [Lithospermum erythrorhizon]|nr:hypothetical protein Leryth_011271 [Lithospermum erythrorhizon]